MKLKKFQFKDNYRLEKIVGGEFEYYGRADFWWCFFVVSLIYWFITGIGGEFICGETEIVETSYFKLVIPIYIIIFLGFKLIDGLKKRR